jgi:hypothetical protein
MPERVRLWSVSGYDRSGSHKFAGRLFRGTLEPPKLVWVAELQTAGGGKGSIPTTCRF